MPDCHRVANGRSRQASTTSFITTLLADSTLRLLEFAMYNYSTSWLLPDKALGSIASAIATVAPIASATTTAIVVVASSRSRSGLSGEHRAECTSVVA